MVEFPFGRCSKRCQIQNRPLLPGERYYSVVMAGKDQTQDDPDNEGVRFDISASAWTGPPEHAIGWWMKEMPREEQIRVRPATPLELLDRLAMLCDDPSEAAMASLLATLLVRRRVLVPNPNSSYPNSSYANSSGGVAHEFSEYAHRGSNSQFCVPMTDVALEEEMSLQSRLQQLLIVEVEPATVDGAISAKFESKSTSMLPRLDDEIGSENREAVE